jgi:group I intron endonuclease
MIYYYLYQITNLINHKIYIGVHKTRNLNDNYIGSGKIIKDAIKKYGIINFRKDIIEFFKTSHDMYEREKEIVTEEFLLREDTYNLRRGGTGGFDYINNSGIPKFLGKTHTEETKSKQGHVHTFEEKERSAKRMLGNNRNPNIKLKGHDHPAFSKQKSDSHKEKLRLAGVARGKQKTVTCANCGKEGGERLIKRWHKNCGISLMA